MKHTEDCEINGTTVVFEDNTSIDFNTEEQACRFQRAFRFTLGLCPMCGEALVPNVLNERVCITEGCNVNSYEAVK